MYKRTKPIGDYGGEQVTLRYGDYDTRTYYHHPQCSDKDCSNGSVPRRSATGSYRAQCDACRVLCFPREEHRRARRELAKDAKDRALRIEAKLKALTGTPASRWPVEKLGRFNVHADPNEIVWNLGRSDEARALATEWRQAFDEYNAW